MSDKEQELHEEAVEEVEELSPLDAAFQDALKATEAKEDAEETEEAVEDSEPSEEEEPEELAAEPEQADEFKVPEHWSSAAKDKFAQLKGSKELDLVRQITKEIESAHTKRSQEFAEVRKTGEAVAAAFEPFQAELQQTGMTPAQAVAALVNERNTFLSNMRANPKATLENLAAQYGVTFEQQRSDDEDYLDPDLVATRKLVENLQAELSQLKNQQVQASQAELHKTINQFSEARDEHGELLHPHYARLQTVMGGLLASGAAKDLTDAYQKALRSDNELYEQDIKTRMEQELKRKEEQRLADIEKAKKAKRRLSGSGPARPTRVESIDDAFQQAFQELSAAN